jgi:hypothetical protein
MKITAPGPSHFITEVVSRRRIPEQPSYDSATRYSGRQIAQNHGSVRMLTRKQIGDGRITLRGSSLGIGARVVSYKT